MSIQQISISNFSVFESMTLHPAAGVNVLVGENGTGKTQLLKLLYVCAEVQKDHLSDDFYRCFGIQHEKTSLIRQPEQEAVVNLTDADGRQKMTRRLEEGYILSFPAHAVPTVYIPVKDMLTHAKGLLAMAEKYRDFPFDKTLTDIIRRANQWSVKEPPALARAILPQLEQMMDGQVVIEEDTFYIRKHDGRLVNFTVEAEGLKKIGLLWQLLMTENITENSLLLWDEPEANLNPAFLPQLVECLLELSRHGVQVFVSTHNYIFAKYFDVRRKATDHIAYHSLYVHNNGVACESKEHFAELQHNAIMQVFNQLLDEVYNLQVGD